MPPASTHQCHINATYQCPSELPFYVTYRCQSVLPINAMPVSVTYQCQSVPPISATYQCYI
ncbi:unnamed protein product [Staurois parvus]|uniref:Uncharacterized protein n=1 Tax=Staurois parvus TaxID=386267 RepID=A0ABN9H8Q0_9NEOB|nr:unnamed protein product [Staurois parvus]